jgi:HD-GYP domain-containing protein (c-di-GMP phosphodiesterase class II)
LLRSCGEIAEAVRAELGHTATSRADGAGGEFVEIEVADTVIVLVWPAVWHDPARLRPHLIRCRSGRYPLLLCGTEQELADGAVDTIGDPATVAPLVLPISRARLVAFVRAEVEDARRYRSMASRDLMLERARYEVELLLAVGRALSQERDTDSLLARILRDAREATGADAGSVYVVEGEAEDPRQRTLRFKVSQNDSVAVGSVGFTMPVSPKSIVGACVLGRAVIDIPDLYALDEPGTGNNPWGFRHDRSFDDRHGYQTRSMLTVPMISARDQVIGVIQLINRRGRGVTRLSEAADFERNVVPFDAGTAELAAALASQAGIALENRLLYEEVRALFDGFVRASVTAIESRDPTTSGHSERVAQLTLGLARAADRCDTGPYAGLTVSIDELKEIEYAALLHDFGKVGVREHVLVKAKKLYPHERELVLARFQMIRKAMEAEQLESKVRYLMEASRDEAAARLADLDRDAAARLAELDDMVRFVLQANEPTVLEQGGFERIAEIAARSYRGGDGRPAPYLTPEEAAALQLGRGSLTTQERVEIESHVVHTYNFLRQIPWGRAFQDIPVIAGAHHEKLDGTGYPRRMAAADIPVQARMMSISDIYDALTASDRPYKKAVPEDRALDIIQSEVKANKLDADLFRLFVDARVFELVRTGAR